MGTLRAELDDTRRQLALAEQKVEVVERNASDAFQKSEVRYRQLGSDHAFLRSVDPHERGSAAWFSQDLHRVGRAPDRAMRDRFPAEMRDRFQYEPLNDSVNRSVSLLVAIG